MRATAADRGLIDHAAKHGFTLGPRQLKRWRAYGAMPRRMRRHHGRGRGTSSSDGPDAADQLIALCRRLAVDRRLARATLWLWYENWEIPTHLVRRQVRAQLAASETPLLTRKQQIQKKQRRTGLNDEVDPFDVAAADTHAHPVSREEQARMRDLAAEQDDPSGRATTPTELVHHARAELTALTLASPDEITLDGQRLLHRYGGAPLGDLAAEQGRDLASELVGGLEIALAGVDTSGLLRDAPDSAYLEVREIARNLWELVGTQQSALARDVTAAAGPAAAQNLVSNLTPKGASWDTRDPNYTHAQLLTILTALLVLDAAIGSIQPVELGY
jgi:hypothetical protein